jgi:polysaccharide export outer membrane protein
MKLLGTIAKLGSILALTALVPACAASTTGENSTTGPADAEIVQRTETLPAPEIVAAIPNSSEAEYHIGPGDVVEVSVFQVPDLSKTVQVSASGEIALPLIGVIAAGGKTVADLEMEIAAKLGEKYLQSPQVSVFVKEPMSQRVTVEGAVANPGILALTGPTTLLQTVALSGGLKDGADARGIVVFRTVNQQRMAAKFDLTAIRAGKALDPVLHGGDIVVVDQSGISSALGALRQNLPMYGLFSALLL